MAGGSRRLVDLIMVLLCFSSGYKSEYSGWGGKVTTHNGRGAFCE